MCLYARLLVRLFFLFSLLMSVTVSGYIITHCMSIYVCPLCLCAFFSLNICIIVGLYCHWLYVYMYVFWSVCLSHFLSVNASICVQLYCHWLYVYRYLSSSNFLSVSLSLCLCQCPGILLVNLRIYVHILIGISLSLFVSECVKQCPTILSLIVGVSVHLLIRVSHSLFCRNVSIRVRLYCLRFYVYRYVSSSPFVSHSLSQCLCLSQCPSIFLVIYMYVISRVQLDQRVIAL